jgi:hypothetical protein
VFRVASEIDDDTWNMLRLLMGATNMGSDIPIKIKPIKARTLMLENQNSSSPNTRTPRRLMKKTGGRG